MVAVVFLMACGGGSAGGPGGGSEGTPGEGTGPTGSPLVDADGDGVPAAADCDDGDDSVYPGGEEEPYDGLDNDCDPSTPDDDLDGDGAGLDDDCDDTDPDVHPGAAEVEGDGIDNDCDPGTCLLQGFEDSGASWALPDYGDVFNVIADSYCSGAGDLGYTVMDIDGDGLVDLVVHDDCGQIGTDHWMVHEGDGAGFAATGTRWDLPPYGDVFNVIADSYCSGAGDLGYTVMDLTGDGVPDLVVHDDCGAIGTDHWMVHEGTSTGFAASGTRWDLPPYGDVFNVIADSYCSGAGDLGYTVMDVDGDRLVDLVVHDDCGRIGTDHWMVHAGTGSGFAATGSRWELPAYGDVFNVIADSYCSGAGDLGYTVMDVDGDRLVDLVVHDDCGQIGTDHWMVHAGTGSGFAATGTRWDLPAYGDVFNVIADSYCSGAGDLGYTVMDVDGDGAVDLVVHDDCAQIGTDHWVVHPGDGSGFDPSPTRWELPAYGDVFNVIADSYCSGAGDLGYTVMDVDGDRLVDLVVHDDCGQIGTDHWVVHPGACVE